MLRLRENFRGVKVGDKFGTRTVIGVPFDLRVFPASQPTWRNAAVSCVVKCSCGSIQIATVCDLVKPGFKSCYGCRGLRLIKHGRSHTPLGDVWKAMRRRCQSPKHVSYHNYGGRGIEVCAEWDSDFVAFESWALSNGYGRGMEIDRFPNRDGNYEPSNCRWVTGKENSRNTRTNRVIEAFGESKCVAEWLDDPRCVVSRRSLMRRISKGIAPEIAITTECLKEKRMLL